MEPSPKNDGPQERPHDVTRMLLAWSRGDRAALDELTPIVYDELRRLAERYLRRERPGHTLQPTALVHETYLRLVDQQQVNWHNRAQFLGIAAEFMRRILLKYARSRHAAKRGGGACTMSLDEVIGFSSEPRAVDLIALDETLTRLAAMDPQKGQIVELRFFGGLTEEETAETLGVAPITVKREWRVARAWLQRELDLGAKGE